MKTLIISDLHLGSGTGSDLLRHDGIARQRLFDAIEPGSRLIFAGDLLELRHAPSGTILERAGDFLRAVGRHLGPDGKIVLLAGNHDHHIVRNWLVRRRLDGKQLGLSELAEPDEVGQLAQSVAELLQPASLQIAYPGFWLIEPGTSEQKPGGVYVMHGHYSDVLLPVPTVERLSAGIAAKIQGVDRSTLSTPEDFERLVGPGYGWSDAIAEYATGNGGSKSSRTSASVWEHMQNKRSLKGLGYRIAVHAAVLGLDFIGLDGLNGNVTPDSLRLAGINAVGEAVTALGIGADHVIYGHTHRAGPQPHDPLAEWTLESGVSLHNTGCWVHGGAVLNGNESDAPYWPGRAIEVDESGTPRLLSLLSGVEDPWQGQPARHA